MGNQRQFIDGPERFSAFLYENHPDFEPIEINGIEAKVVKLITDKEGKHSGLPTFSNTSTMYLRLGSDGSVVQAKLYNDRHQILDFDWGHEHKNKGSNRDSFPKGVVHVQAYTDVKTRNSNNARLMSDAEIALYGPILEHFYPGIKFRP